MWCRTNLPLQLDFKYTRYKWLWQFKMPSDLSPPYLCRTAWHDHRQQLNSRTSAEGPKMGRECYTLWDEAFLGRITMNIWA